MRYASNRKNDRGLTLAEMITTTAVIGILGAIGIGALSSKILPGTSAVKLRQDMGVLNSAILAYQVSGGNLPDNLDEESVIAKLKTTASASSRNFLPGFTGSFLSQGVEFQMQTSEEAKTEMPRLRWNDGAKKFEIATSGENGIKVVRDNSESKGVTENREENRSTTFGYAASGNWIWEYEEQKALNRKGVTDIVNTPTDSTLPPPIVVPERPLANLLAPPLFSIPGGRYPGTEFDLALSFTNPNPEGSSDIFCSINYTEWTKVDEVDKLSISSDSLVKAQAIPRDASIWTASASIDETYEANPLPLLPPLITFSDNFFVSGKSKTVDTIAVTLANPNSSEVSQIIYRLASRDEKEQSRTQYQIYDGRFEATSANFPDGFVVRAFVESSNSNYTDSRTTSKFATKEKGLFDGHLDLDTSSSISSIGNGSTGAHTHDITGKYGIHAIDFFAIPDSKQIELTEAIKNRNQKFKLIVVNGDLSPGLALVLDYDSNGKQLSRNDSVNDYDDTSSENLTVFSLSGVDGTARLSGAKMVMTQDVIKNAGIIPTNTGDVKSNTPGKNSEWRNGALTLQAVAVADDGSDSFSTNESLSAGDHGAATNGLLWEASLFWHWEGDSYHKNGFVPGKPESLREKWEKTKKGKKK